MSEKEKIKRFSSELDVTMSYWLEECFKHFLQHPSKDVKGSQTEASINITIGKSLLAEIRKEAYDLGISIADWMRMAIGHFLEMDDQEWFKALAKENEDDS